MSIEPRGGVAFEPRGTTRAPTGYGDDGSTLQANQQRSGNRATADAWLAHYVKLKFFYVAMRYEPRGAEAGPQSPSSTNEDLRLGLLGWPIAWA